MGANSIAFQAYPDRSGGHHLHDNSNLALLSATAHIQASITLLVHLLTFHACYGVFLARKALLIVKLTRLSSWTPRFQVFGS